MPPLEWKSKRSDILIVIALFILITIGFHILLSLRGSRHDHTDSIDKFLKHLSDPFLFFLALFGALIAYSPMYAFRFKVPKAIKLDFTEGLLKIQRRYRKKEQLIALEGIGYAYFQQSVFSVLEIYHTFETNRGSYRRRFRTIIVPFWGMAINRKDLREIVGHLKEHGAIEEPNVQRRSLQELMQD
jgi:hypothetical protein